MRMIVTILGVNFKSMLLKNVEEDKGKERNPRLTIMSIMTDSGKRKPSFAVELKTRFN